MTQAGARTRQPLSAKAVQALIKTPGPTPLATEEPRTPLDMVELAVAGPVRRTVVSGEFEAREARQPPEPVVPQRPRRCPRSAEPTWQIPRRLSAVDAVRRVFGIRR